MNNARRLTLNACHQMARGIRRVRAIHRFLPSTLKAFLNTAQGKRRSHATLSFQQPTLKAFHNVAQGKRRSRATLGFWRAKDPHPEGVPQPKSGCAGYATPSGLKQFVIPITQGGAPPLRDSADPGLCCSAPIGAKATTHVTYDTWNDAFIDQIKEVCA